MARCMACDKQINFGKDLCKRCQSASDSMYSNTAEDVTTIEHLMYTVRSPRLLDDYAFNELQGELIDEDVETD